MTLVLEEQVVLFVDLLGFSEASVRDNEELQKNVLALLRSIAEMKSEFSYRSEENEPGSTTHSMVPSISTFSDHIVISYPIDRIEGEDRFRYIMIASQVQQLLSFVAISALEIGFLIRGGMAIGKLYHSAGVVFGEAMVEAFRLESRTAIYPRVVISKPLADKMGSGFEPWVLKDFDGIYRVEYFFSLLAAGILPGEKYAETVQARYRNIVAILRENIVKLDSIGKLNERAKWVWFSRQFAEYLKTISQEVRKFWGVSIDELPLG